MHHTPVALTLAGLLGAAAALLAGPPAALAAPAVGKVAAAARVPSGVAPGGVVEAGAPMVKCGLACSVRRPPKKRGR